MSPSKDTTAELTEIFDEIHELLKQMTDGLDRIADKARRLRDRTQVVEEAPDDD